MESILCNSLAPNSDVQTLDMVRTVIDPSVKLEFMYDDDVDLTVIYQTSIPGFWCNYPIDSLHNSKVASAREWSHHMF